MSHFEQPGNLVRERFVRPVHRTDGATDGATEHCARGDSIDAVFVHCGAIHDDRRRQTRRQTVPMFVKFHAPFAGCLLGVLSVVKLRAAKGVVIKRIGVQQIVLLYRIYGDYSNNDCDIIGT